MNHTCVLDDGGTPNRRCDGCEAERQKANANETCLQHERMRAEDNTRYNRLTPEERYGRDPWFRQLVDFLTIYLKDPKFEDNYTPSELREAVILAATRVENIRAYNRMVRFDRQIKDGFGIGDPFQQ